MEYFEEKVASGFKKFFKFLFYGLFALLFIALFGFVVQYLWNWLMPEIFGLPVLTYWKAVGLLLLSKILFSSMGGGKHHGSKSGKSHWRRRFRQRWENMSEEERAKFEDCWPSRKKVTEKRESEESENLSSE